jgi:hypothetical protein
MFKDFVKEEPDGISRATTRASGQNVLKTAKTVTRSPSGSKTVPETVIVDRRSTEINGELAFTAGRLVKFIFSAGGVDPSPQRTMNAKAALWPGETDKLG